VSNSSPTTSRWTKTGEIFRVDGFEIEEIFGSKIAPPQQQQQMQ
jgi:hypothetical protein